MAKEPEPPDKIEVRFVGPNGDVVGSYTFAINRTPPPPTTYDDQSWTEAVAFDEFLAAMRTQPLHTNDIEQHIDRSDDQ